MTRAVLVACCLGGAWGLAAPRGIPRFIDPASVAELTETAAVETLKAVETAELTLTSGTIGSTFVRTKTKQQMPWETKKPPVVLLHGFDSSCLEFRRLLPELEKRELEAYAVDILGWGFCDTAAATSVSIEAKREALYAFWSTVLEKRPMVLAGVSLGAAVIIDFYDNHPEAVAAVQLIDPQGFIDGAPSVPRPLAKGGIAVLKSWPLRSLANQLAYLDTETFATDDAIRIGLLHCQRPKWDDDSVDWLLGGGYSVSALVPKLQSSRVSILWGRQDEILPPADFLPKFIEALPSASFRWIEECGHSPHLEQPAVLADAIAAFVDDRQIAGKSDVAFDAAPSSPLEKLNALLDTPILDTNVKGGPLEPVKQFARDEPEVAQVIASATALAFFAGLAKAAIVLTTLV